MNRESNKARPDYVIDVATMLPYQRIQKDLSGPTGAVLADRA
jgi:hypothetical protein